MRSALLLVGAGLVAGCTDPFLPSATGGGGGAAEGGGGHGGIGQGGQGAATSEWDFGLPPGIPSPQVPSKNPMSEAKVALGRRLFYDVRLSLNEQQSCASCHLQELGFTDGKVNAVGSTGQVHRRNSMSLTNVAYLTAFTWANPLVDRLEDQARLPLFGETPIELGFSGQEDVLVERLASDADYPALFAAAFPDDELPISVTAVTYALAAFERTLLSFDSPFDHLTYGGDPDALSASAKRGRDLFFSEALECFHCHGGFNFSDSVAHEGTQIVEVMFHNTGLYNLDGQGAFPAIDTGLFEISHQPSDMGRFRAPTLRNIAVTAPYMHDGSAATLDDVIDHYAAGGRTLTEGPYAGVGSDNPFKSEFVNGFEITAGERSDLKAFLESLTDTTFLTNPSLSDPFAARP